MTFLGFALAALIGISLGLLGGGGSILTVPILVYVLGFGAKEAIAASLGVVGTTSLVGALRHWQAGNVRLRVAAVFGVVAMAGSFAGARAATFLSGTLQLLLFAVVMLLAALFMFRGPVRESTANEPPPTVAALAVAGAGLAVGGLTGIVGVGGGFLIVPTLVLLLRIPMKEAVGTSLVVIALNAFSGFVGYLDQVSLPWGYLTGFTAVAVAGILVGTHLVRYVSQRALRRAFAVFLVIMGLFILYKNRGALGLPREGAPTAPRAG